jgi:WD40 repeat protein
MCISDLVTNHQIGNVIAGCSDGTLRIFDGSWRKGNFKELTKVRAHSGGVVHVATAGNLICTTGYSSRSPTTYGTGTSKPYAFPDEHVLVFDIRYLGKGGIMHPFMGLKGGPRHVSFLPGEGNDDDQRILVCSGQPGGGIQIIRPFEAVNTGNHKPEFNDFLNLPLETTEAITAVSCVGTNLALGTNHGNVLQFCMDSHDQTKTGLSQESLDVPSLLEAPPLSIDPQLLQGSITHNALSISVFNPYVMCAEPMVSPTEANGYAFGPLSSNTLIPTGRRKLSKSLEQMLSSRTPDEYAANIQTSQLGLDIFKSNRIGKAPGNIMNANKLLHGKGFASVCYNINADPRKKDQQERGRDNVSFDSTLLYHLHLHLLHANITLSSQS